VIELTEPQVWAALGILLGFLTATLTVTTRTITVQIGGLRNEIRSEIGGLRVEMNARFDTVNVRIDNLDRDVQALTDKVFGTGG
jgi:hypothetical protein